jgi:hypothetical protein
VNAGAVTDHAQRIGADRGVPPPERVTHVVLLHAQLHHDGPRILIDQEIEQKVVARLTGDPRCVGEGSNCSMLVRASRTCAGMALGGASTATWSLR